VLLRHTDRAATTEDWSTLDWSTPDGRYQVPVSLTGRDAHVMVAGYDMGGQRLAYSTSEIMTHARIGGRDVALLYGPEGSEGWTVLKYASEPTVQVLEGHVHPFYVHGDLRFHYEHEGLARVLVTGGGRPPLLLLLGTDEEAAKFWRADTAAGPVLVRGTELLRSARMSGSTVTLRADVAEAGEVEVFAPAKHVVIGSKPVAVRRTPSGSLLGSVPGPKPVRLPALTGWRARSESVVDNDARWTVADHTTSESPFPPVTQPVLYAGDYGADTGHVWYQGRFTATGTETALSLNAITGKNGVYQVWLNGKYLGWANGGVEADADAPVNPRPGPGTFTFPALKPGTPAVFSVLVENMGHNDDWTADDNRFKQPRGLVGASLEGSSAPVTWRLQGNRTDKLRGPLNTGGLHGERAGWYLPQASDRGWGRPPATVQPGVTWYRTEFGLDLPRGQDVSVGLRFGGTGSYRVLFYLNGWQLGEFTANLGPQREFVLPAGILREHGKNTLTMAVIGLAESTLGPVSLVTLGNNTGGVPIANVPA
jgi:hypothetical protein